MTSVFKHSFWERGFRPFFLLGGIYSVFTVIFWALQFQGYLSGGHIFIDPVIWHGHEMVFGFTLAIIAGFLLTAVANWTGWAPVREGHLAALCALWIAGRVVMFLPPMPFYLAEIIQLSFIPALTVSLAVPLLGRWQKRNFVFLGLLSVMWVCDAILFVYEDKRALYIAVLVILAMISLIGGRVIPTFTVAGLRMKGVSAFSIPQPRLDVICLVSLVLLAVGIVVWGMSPVVGAVAAMSSFLHLWRMRRYNTDKVWGEPLLWILHLGYLWLVVGLLLLAATGFGLFSLSPALHALTAGCIGTMTLGMMARVSLGHTGRVLRVGKMTVSSFIFIQLAALMRVFGPLVLASSYHYWIIGASVFWALAFALYVWEYTPVLLSKRGNSRSQTKTGPTASRFKNMKVIQKDED